MQQLEQLLAKGVPWPTVGRIILLLSPQALGLTIPMALLVGLLIGLGRLSTDRESVALLACGVSPYRLLRPVLVLAGLATAATMYVMIEAIPDANQEYREILFATLTKKVESDIKPRVFFQEFPDWVLYPRNEAEPGRGRLVGRPARQYVKARRGGDVHGPARPDRARSRQAHGRAGPDRRHAITRPPGPASRARRDSARTSSSGLDPDHRLPAGRPGPGHDREDDRRAAERTSRPREAGTSRRTTRSWRSTPSSRSRRRVWSSR